MSSYVMHTFDGFYDVGMPIAKKKEKGPDAVANSKYLTPAHIKYILVAWENLS